MSVFTEGMRVNVSPSIPGVPDRLVVFNGPLVIF